MIVGDCEPVAVSLASVGFAIGASHFQLIKRTFNRHFYASLFSAKISSAAISPRITNLNDAFRNATILFSVFFVLCRKRLLLYSRIWLPNHVGIINYLPSWLLTALYSGYAYSAISGGSCVINASWNYHNVSVLFLLSQKKTLVIF